MATEPPAKRMRLTCPDRPEPDSEDDQDGDELVFKPHEVSQRRDPDYQLTRKRIKAGNRFQQAMSGIFAKYARDFTHVGDEIDLETGEIVVDNGHLHNMQFEGDVGVDEEDEGMLLEDFLDEEDDDDGGVRLRDLRDDEELCSEEEERIMHGQESPPPHKPNNALMHMADPVQPPSLQMKPWGFLDDTRAMDRAHPTQKPRRRRSVHAMLAPYSGANSIWTPEPDYVDDWTPISRARVATMGSLRKTVSSSRLLAPPQADSDRDMQTRNSEPVNLFGGEDDLMDAYQSTKASSDPNQENPTPSRVMIMRTMRGLPEKSEPPPKPSPKVRKSPPKPKSTSKRLPAKRSSLQPTPFDQLVAVRKQVALPPPDPNRRRSSRARRQTDFMGKISWTEALGKDQGANFVVEISSPTLRKEDYESVDGSLDQSVDEHGLPTPPDSGPEMEDVEPVVKERTIPDSQETVKSSPRAEKAQQAVGDAEEGIGVQYAFGKPSFELSDDEAPIILTKRTKFSKRAAVVEPAPKPAVAAENVAAEGTSSRETRSQADEPAQQSGHNLALSLRQSLELQASTSLDTNPLPQGDQVDQPTSEPAVPPLESDAPAEEPRPRGRGRPRKPAQHPDQKQTHTPELDKAQPRRPGRPRKSSPSKPDEPAPEVADSQEDVDPKEHDGAAAASSELKPIKRARGRPRTRRQDDEAVPDAPPSVEKEVYNEPMEIDTITMAAPEHAPHPLSSNHTIADSTAEPASSTSQQIPESTPSRLHKHSKVNSPKPSTPRHTALRTSKTPTSRRSILSLLSDDGNDDDDEGGGGADTDSATDELLRSDDLPRLFNSPTSSQLRRRNPVQSAATNKKKTTWKATPLTTEIYRTPVKRKRRRAEDETVRTPGGTTRTCGVDGYRCGRDFCFNCL